MKMMRLFLLFGIFNICHTVLAQNLMVIHQGNGTKLQIPLESIDSVRFATVPPPIRQKIFQNNGNILSLSVADIDSITYIIPNAQALAGVSTQAVTVLSSSSAYGGGLVASNGGSAVTQRGLCWSTSPNPTLANNFTVDGAGTGSFGSTMAPLQAATTYYVRAYAVNSEGTAYGNSVVFTTSNPSGSGLLATITTANVVYTSGLTANCGGNITADGGLAVTARGVCWAAGTTPTINHNHTVDGAGAGSFTSILSNLLPNTTYFVRAYATNDAGTAYGISYAFTTHDLPMVTTKIVTGITTTAAVSGGNIGSDGGGSIFARGVCWSTSQNPTIALSTKTVDGSGIGGFTSNLLNLSQNTTYYLRAYATNAVGSSYGSQLSFTTPAIVLPTLTTKAITLNSIGTGQSGGDISFDGGNDITARGICWSTTENPTIALSTKTVDGTGTGSFTSSLTGLIANTPYYVRAYATNSAGTAYGNQVSTANIMLTTTAVTMVTKTTALSGGGFFSAGVANIIAKGLCWSTSTDPTIDLITKTMDGEGNGTFTSNLTGLDSGTTYYVRAYASNFAGTSYGKQQSFTTLAASRVRVTFKVNMGTQNIAASGVHIAGSFQSPQWSPSATSMFDIGGGIWSYTILLSPNSTISFKFINGNAWGNNENPPVSCTSGAPDFNRVLTIGSTDQVFLFTYNSCVTYIGATLSTTSVSGITSTSANSGGNITSGDGITARGVWKSKNQQQLGTGQSNGTGPGIFTSSLTNLEPNTTYYVRAWATNSAGTSHGNEKVFNTPGDVGFARLSTRAATSITSSTASSGSNAINDGGSAITAKGVVWSTESNPTIALTTKTNNGTGTGSFTSSLTGLSPNTLYYVRAYAFNSVGTAYGNQISFSTPATVLPTITTTAISAITTNTASSGGAISNNGGSAITSKGVVWSTKQNPTIALITKTNNGTSTVSFTSSITGLSPDSVYYVRAYATNSAGTAYGNQITFITSKSLFNPSLTYGTMSDNDGNTYKTILIGTQTWMAENLKTSKYRNGDPIPTNLTDAAWSVATTGAYAIYNNDAANNTTYGKLYNWYAVVDSRNLCPTGWHVPSDGEWTILEDFLLGGSSVAGGKLKSTSSLWNTPNTGATNESGFSGLPGGGRDNGGGTYYRIGSYGYWWSSTGPSADAWLRSLNYNNGDSRRFDTNKQFGFSVRCLKD